MYNPFNMVLGAIYDTVTVMPLLINPLRYDEYCGLSLRGKNKMYTYIQNLLFYYGFQKSTLNDPSLRFRRII